MSNPDPAGAALAGEPDAKALARAVRASLQCASVCAGSTDLEAGAACALFVLSLSLAAQNGWLDDGARSRWTSLGAAELLAELASDPLFDDLHARTGGALPQGDAREHLRVVAASPAHEETRQALAALVRLQAPIDALSLAYEGLSAQLRGRAHRKEKGVYYTPPEVAAQVVELAFARAPSFPARPRAFDCCAGAGVFLLAAARAMASRGVPIAEAVQLCAGADLDARALSVTRAALALLAGPGATAESLRALSLEPLDSLRPAARQPGSPPRPGGFDLLVTNPPYGHVPDARERSSLARRYPALHGAEIDLYAAFILRSLELIRPGGSAALLVPDTWMTNARSSALRAEVLEQAALIAVADLGKPFAAAKDTRVQALVLSRRERRTPPGALTFTARLEQEQLIALAPLGELELRANLAGGWQPYRSHSERALVAAMEAASVPLGSLCSVGYGLRTGDNPRHVVRGEVPPGAIGLAGGEEIEPFRLQRKPKWLRDPSPELLRLAKKQQGIPRLAVQRIRTNAAVPWARWLEAAPIPPELVCLDSLSTLAADDADLLWALLALLGSVAMNRYHRLRTTDVNVKPSALRELPAPRLLADADIRTNLVNLSKQRAEEPDPLRAHRLERRIDRAVHALYALDESLIEESERGFWGPRFDTERAALAADPDAPLFAAQLRSLS